MTPVVQLFFNRQGQKWPCLYPFKFYLDLTAGKFYGISLLNYLFQKRVSVVSLDHDYAIFYCTAGTTKTFQCFGDELKFIIVERETENCRHCFPLTAFDLPPNSYNSIIGGYGLFLEGFFLFAGAFRSGVSAG